MKTVRTNAGSNPPTLTRGRKKVLGSRYCFIRADEFHMALWGGFIVPGLYHQFPAASIYFFPQNYVYGGFPLESSFWGKMCVWVHRHCREES